MSCPRLVVQNLYVVRLRTHTQAIELLDQPVAVDAAEPGHPVHPGVVVSGRHALRDDLGRRGFELCVDVGNLPTCVE